MSFTYALGVPAMPLMGLYREAVCPGKLNVKVYVPVWVGVYRVYVEDVASDVNGPKVSLVPSGFEMVTL